jgi:hypothetical protein
MIFTRQHFNQDPLWGLRVYLTIESAHNTISFSFSYARVHSFRLDGAILLAFGWSTVHSSSTLLHLRCGHPSEPSACITFLLLSFFRGIHGGILPSHGYILLPATHLDQER